LCCAQSNDACPRSPFSAEGNFNAKRPKRRLRATGSRPASARGDFGHPSARHDMDSLVASAPIRRRSDAFPVQAVRSVINSRRRVATGSASITSSSAALRFASYARTTVPAGQKAVSQAVDQRASAIRGSRSKRTLGRFRNPQRHRGCTAVQLEKHAKSLARGAAGSRAGAAESEKLRAPPSPVVR
jgi:hypothetical protein